MFTGFMFSFTFVRCVGTTSGASRLPSECCREDFEVSVVLVPLDTKKVGLFKWILDYHHKKIMILSHLVQQNNLHK